MKCSECGTKMEKDDISWQCPKCVFFKLKSTYAKLEEQNGRFLRSYLDDDDLPEGCAACGNPAYPNCQSSCSMFDD